MAEQLSVPLSRSYWVVPGLLLAGEYPGAKEPAAARRKIEKLLDAGLRLVINLMQEHEVDFWGSLISPYEHILGDLASERNMALEMQRFPVVDMRTPTPEQMRDILDAIDAALERRKPVYVHCLGGIGRTGTVVGCFLIRHGFAGTDDVLDKIARLRAKSPQAHRPAPEAPIQREFVRRWPDSETMAPGRRKRPWEQVCC